MTNIRDIRVPRTLTEAEVRQAFNQLQDALGEHTHPVADLSDASANGRSLISAANYAAMRALLDLEIGTDVQAYDADLTTWAGLTPSANAQSLVTAANYASMRALLDLEAGTDFPSLTTFNDHSARHESGGDDAIKLDDLAAPDDNTDLNASTTAHGLLPKLSNVATEFLTGQGTWAIPSTGSAYNYIINGGFDIWHRQSAPGTLTGYLDDVYCADRWIVLYNSSGVGTDLRVSRESAISEGATFSIEVDPASAPTDSIYKAGLLQIVDQLATYPMRGQTVRAQARVKVDSGTCNFRIAIVEWTGTADTVTSDIVNDWTSTTYTAGNFFKSTTTTVTTSSDVSVSTSYTSLSVTATIGSSTNNVMVFVWMTDNTDVVWNMTKVGLYVGSTSRDWLPRLYIEELQLCQRRCISYGNHGGTFERIGIGQATSTTAADIVIHFPVEMAYVPSLVSPTVASFFLERSAGAAQQCTVIGVNSLGMSRLIGALTINVSANLNAGDATNFGKNNNTTDLLIFHAEL